MLLQKEVVAIILGGGRGTRLYPLTKVRAKPAVSVAGKYRIVDIPISNCLHSKIDRIFVLTQFQSGSLNRHIFRTYRFESFGTGFIEVLPAQQHDLPDAGGWYQGTADAVRRNLREFLQLPARDYLILAGDQLYRMDFADLFRAHRESQADITVAVTPVAREAAHAFGIMKLARTAGSRSSSRSRRTRPCSTRWPCRGCRTG
jgi:glucose-1-phosphate adenylyltransferase